MTQQIIRTYRDGVLIHEETVELPDAPPTPGEQISALAVAARLSVTETVRSGDLPVEMLAQLAPIYPLWEPGLSVAAGDVLSWDSTLVECVQAHTTQADWAPGLTPALWRVYRDVANEPATPDWQAGIAVTVGETFGYLGHVYRVRQAHTTQKTWEPPNVPALWQIVE